MKQARKVKKAKSALAVKVPPSGQKPNGALAPRTGASIMALPSQALVGRSLLHAQLGMRGRDEAYCARDTKLGHEVVLNNSLMGAPIRATPVHVILCLRLLYLALACVCSASTALAQYRFDSWTTDNGLPHNSISDILQTRDGYLWLTTSDGLVRFDGVRFTVFERGNTKGLNSNRFTALFEGREGSLWIGTEDRGLARYRDGTFTSYTTEDGLPDYLVWGMREDTEGNLLVLTQQGISQWKNEKFIPYPSDDIARNLRRSGGNIHIGFSYSDAAGLHRFEQGRYRTYTQRDGLSSLNIQTLYEDQHGTLWIVTKDAGLNRLKDGVFTVFPTDGLPSREIEAVYEDRAGNIWIGTNGGGLTRFKDGVFKTYGAAHGLAGKRIRTIYEDREGLIWVGTNTNGLYQMRKEIITSYSERDGLSLNNVYTVYEDREGHIWIGTWGGGLNKYQDGIFTHYTTDDGLSDEWATALYEDRDGYLWIGTNEGGVCRFKDGRFTIFDEKDGLANRLVLAIEQDRAGHLWFGTGAGLSKHQDGTFTTFTTKDGLVHPRVQVIHEDHNGNLWLGTFGGISRFRDGVFTSYTERDGLSSNHVRSIYEDADGTLWFGTYDGGLNRFENGKFTRYTTKDGLYSNGVFQILEDGRGHFWMSSNRGIYRVSKKELNDFAEGKVRSITSISFDKRDGMLNAECNGSRQPAGWKTRAGKLWFPTQGGVAVVDPEAVQTSTQPPPVIIEEFILDREPLVFRNSVEISPGKENFEIHYTGLSFIKPEAIKFKYQLEGLDKDWVEAGTRRTAYYSHVPPGEYTFSVMAANSDGVWNTQGAALRIVVHPPFWRTWWFISLMGLCVIGAAILMYERRVLRLKRAHAAQEAFSRQLIQSQENERKRIAAELHDSLGQNLLIIKNRALLGVNVSRDDGAAKEQFDEITASASHAIEEVREIAYNLRPYHLDRLGLTSTIEDMVEKVATVSGIHFTAEIAPLDGLFSKEDEMNLYRIVQESINNIVKHSQATEAKVEITRDTYGVYLTIHDNGRGFVPEATTSTELRRRGFGLTGIAERVRMLGGTQKIRSGPGQGTTVTIKLPLPEARTEDES